jgi:hypothetical protein
MYKKVLISHKKTSAAGLAVSGADSLSGKPCYQLFSQLCRLPFQCGATQRRKMSRLQITLALESAFANASESTSATPLPRQGSLRLFMPSAKTTLAEIC